MASKSAILAVRIIGDAKGAVSAMGATGDATGGLLGKLGGLGPVMAAGAAAVVAGGIAAGKALYGIGETFDEVEDTIRTGTGATGDALDGLVDVAKNVGTQIPAQFENIAPVVADLNTRLGLSGDQLQTVASQYLEAGRILGEDVDIETTTGAFNAFNIQAEDTEGAMDTLFRVAQTTGTSMNSLAGSVEKNAPALLGLGFSFEQSAAMVGVLDKAGLDADRTMAAMGKGMVTLAKQGEEPQAAFQRVTGEINGFLATGDDAAALDLAAQLFGTKGAPQFVEALKNGSLDMATLTDAAQGTGDTILGVGQDTMDAAEKWEILKNKGLVALEPLGSAVFSGVGEALDWVMQLVDSIDFQGFMDGMPAVDGIASGVSGLASSIGAVLIPAIQAVWPTVQTVLQFVGAVLQAGLTIIQGVFNVIVGLFTGDWSQVWTGVGQIVSGAWSLVTSLISGAWDFITNLFNLGKTALSNAWSALWTGITTGVSSATSAVTGTVGGWISGIGSTISNGVSNIGRWWSNGWDRMISAVTSTASNIDSEVGRIPGRITSALGNVGSLLYGAGRDVIQGMVNGIGSMGSAIWDAAKNIAENSVNSIKAALGIHSPSRVAAQLGVNFGQGWVLGLESMNSKAEKAATNLIAPPAVDLLRPDSILTKNATGTAANYYQITVNGALDPVAVADQIERILKHQARRLGGITVGAGA